MTKEEIQKNSEHWYNKYKDAEKQIEEKDKQIADFEKENAELNKKLSKAEADYDKMFWNKNEIISKAKEILQVVLDKWKEERWILQSEEEVRMIGRFMKQAERFLTDNEVEE